jgi:two-component system response regulator FixJ
VKTNEQKLVYIVDDDRQLGLALEVLLSGRGYEVLKFTSPLHFLSHVETATPSCALVDIRMPEMDGLQLQEEMVRRRIPTSSIMITGYADVGLAVQAMKAGAFDLLEKPFDNAKLLDLLPAALAAAKAKWRADQEIKKASSLFQRLSPREKEIAILLASGTSNKAVADRLALSPRTVEHHRASLMDKLEVSTLAGLIQLMMLLTPVASLR